MSELEELEAMRTLKYIDRPADKEYFDLLRKAISYSDAHRAGRVYTTSGRVALGIIAEMAAHLVQYGDLSLNQLRAVSSLIDDANEAEQDLAMQSLRRIGD